MSANDKADAKGFDDQFNEGLFRVSHHNSVHARPKQWPKSTSEMGVHTSYREYGGSPGEYNDGLFRAGVRNTALTRPSMWPKSVSEMRHHTSYASQGISPHAHDEERNSYLDRRAGHAAKGRWVYLPSRQGWQWVE